MTIGISVMCAKETVGVSHGSLIQGQKYLILTLSRFSYNAVEKSVAKLHNVVPVKQFIFILLATDSTPRQMNALSSLNAAETSA